MILSHNVNETIQSRRRTLPCMIFRTPPRPAGISTYATIIENDLF